MGRWAYFTTGFEYKFAFGGQSSNDIEEFDGNSNYSISPDYWADVIEDYDEEDKQKAQEVLDAAIALNTENLTQEQFDMLCAIHGESEVFYEQRHTWDGVEAADVIVKVSDLIAANPGAFQISKNVEAIEEYIRSFPLTSEGTRQLWLCDDSRLVGFRKFDEIDPDAATPEYKQYEHHSVLHTVELGLCIAHQLMYEGDLSCIYE